MKYKSNEIIIVIVWSQQKLKSKGLRVLIITYVQRSNTVEYNKPVEACRVVQYICRQPAESQGSPFCGCSKQW